MEQRHREHVHAQRRFETVERFLTSALSQAEFCEQEGLAYWTFRYWLKKYRLREALSPQVATPAETEKHPTAFIPLRIGIPSVNPYQKCANEVLPHVGIDPILWKQFGEFVMGMIGDVGEYVFQIGKQITLVPLHGSQERVDDGRARLAPSCEPAKR